MKKTIRKLVLVLVGIGVIACQQKDDKARVGGGTPARGGTSTPTAASDINLNGTVQIGGSDPEYNVAGLLDSVIPESFICPGAVSVRFGGSAITDGGTVKQAAQNGQAYNINVNGRLRVKAVDSCSGKRDQSGQTIPELPEIYMTQATGYVSGNYAIVRFSNQAGYIEFKGTFDSQQFTGEIEYENAVRADGQGPGAQGTLGQFSVPTCQFFRC